MTEVSLIKKIANKYGVDEQKLIKTLKATAFKQFDRDVSNEELMALLVICDQYNLNPFTKEIHAMSDGRGGIIPVVGVDGWARIINEHPQSDGIQFNYSEEMSTIVNGKQHHIWVECTIYRKDRSKPTTIREYFDEVNRPKNPGRKDGPWQTHPKRMHRHKTLIQGGRIGYGFSGIYDQDEAERIAESNVSVKPTKRDSNIVRQIKPEQDDKTVQLESNESIKEPTTKDVVRALLGTTKVWQEQQQETVTETESESNNIAEGVFDIVEEIQAIDGVTAPVLVSEEVIKTVEILIVKAQAGNLWQKAFDYVNQRMQGDDLLYALDAIKKAEKTKAA
jgi:phage recombination protein Bet